MRMLEAARRFHFEISSNTPLKDLLPPPPKIKTNAVPLVVDDLAQVPEVEFQEFLPLKNPSEEPSKKEEDQGNRLPDREDQSP